MKKILLSLSVLAFAFSGTAQTLDGSDFTNYTVGNIGTSVLGATEGQGGFYTANGLNTDYQIVAEAGDHGNVLQLTGSATTTGNRFMWKDGLADSWEFRDAGNNIMEVEFDVNPSATASKNSIRVQIFNADGTITLGGFLINADTRVVRGLAYYNGTSGIGTYTFRLGTGGTDVTLPSASWSRIGVSLNTVTGEIVWKGPGFYIGGDGAGAGMIPAEVDFVVAAIQATGDANTVASVTKFDNYDVRAVATESLLAVNQVEASANTFNVFPNPVSNVINVSNVQNVNVNKVSITDLNGRVVKESKFNNVSNVQMNVSDLSSGVYMMNISSDKGTSVKKIVKN